MTFVVDQKVEMDSSTCCECGIRSYVPASFKAERRSDHRTFYCPNGHAQHFPQQSETERLRKELSQAEIEKSRLARDLEAKSKSLAQVTKRIANGVCPCCQRTFKQLVAHMKNKHPEYVA
jgi:hypothetical protein